MHYKVSFYKKNIGYEVYNKVLHGFPIHETIDETLDNATIVCHTDDENKFKLWQGVKVEIWNGNNDEGDADYKKCFVIADIETVERHTTKTSYTTTLSLIEPTKYLEKVVCSSMSFTNKEDTLLEQIQKALINAEPIRVGEEPRFKLAQRLKNRLSAVKGEDFFFTKPLLREVLDEMLSVVGFRVYVKEITDFNDIEIDYYDLNEVENQIELQDVLNKQTIHNTEFLATDIEAYGDNSFSGSRRAIYHPSPNGWVVPKTYEATLTTENAVIETNFPIEEIEEFVVPITYKLRSSPQGVDIDHTDWISIKLNISSNILDEESYNVIESSSDETSMIYNTNEYYRENSIYYARGANVIEAGDKYKQFFFPVLHIENAIKNALYRKGVWEGIVSNPDQFSYILLQDFDIEKILYRIKYTPYIDAHAKISKVGYSDVKSTIIDNQSEKIIDLGRYGNNLYGTINRLGNKEVKIDRKLHDMSEDYNIGDITKEGYILTSKTLALYNNFIKAHYEFSKDYSSLSERIGINREKRIYNIPLESFVRDTLIKEYIIASFDTNTETNVLINEFLKTFANDENKPITNAVVATKLGEDVDSPFYELSVAPYTMATSMLFKFRFDDNYSAGMSSGNKVLGGIKQTPNPYVDENGEYNEIFISLINDTFVNKPQDYNLVKELPKVDWGNYPINSQIYPPQVFKIYKDAYEHHSFTMQFEALANNPNIIIGFAIARLNALISTDKHDLKLYVSSTEKYSISENRAVKGQLETNQLITASGNRIIVDGDTLRTNLANVKSWGIADSNGSLLIGVNKVGDENIKTVVYFSHKQARN